MTSLVDRMKGRPLVSGVVALAGGTATGQLITVLTAPLLTRLYTRESFGALTVYVSLLAILVVVASLRYESGIPLPEEDSTAANLLALSLLIATGFALLVAVIAVLAISITPSPSPLTTPPSPPIHENLWRPMGSGHWLWMLPMSLFGAGTYQALSFWAVRRQQFALLGRTRLTQGVAQSIVQILAGFALGGSTAGLLAGDLTGRAAGSGAIATRILARDRAALRTVSWHGIRAAASRYSSFPRFAAPGALLDVAGQQLPAILVAAFYGNSITGLYGLGIRVVALPTILIGQAVGQVYFSEASRIARSDPNRLAALLATTQKKLLLLGLVPAAVLLLFGPQLFAIIFGPSWREAGEYVRILAPMALVQFTVSPVSHTLTAMELQRWQLAWNALWLALTAGSLVAAARLGFGPRAALGCLSCGAIIAYGALHSMMYAATRRIYKEAACG